MDTQGDTGNSKPHGLRIFGKIMATKEQRGREHGKWPACFMTNGQMSEMKHPKPPEVGKKDYEKLQNQNQNRLGIPILRSSTMSCHMGFETGRRGLGDVRSSHMYLITCMSPGSLTIVDKKCKTVIVLQ